MSDIPSTELSRIIARAGQGDASAVDRLFAVVYDQLRALAGELFRRQSPSHTLQPTAVVNEAYARMIDGENMAWKDKAHFMAVAAKVMRNLLIDHARRRKAAKRGGEWERVTLDMVLGSSRPDAIDVLELDDALTELKALHERMYRVVELRYFGGLTVRETAEVLGIARSTVDEDWAMAKAWLTRKLSGDSGTGGAAASTGV